MLEGGGALGFAHIGVIRYLEEHRIQVDMVVGTSMGGLVGGFYATGRSAAIPGVFAPVVVDGHVYPDGGAVDNLAVDVAKRE